MKPMAIMKLVEYMQSEEWSQLSDDLRKRWLIHFYKASQLELTTAFSDGKYKSNEYANSEDYFFKTFEI